MKTFFHTAICASRVTARSNSRLSDKRKGMVIKVNQLQDRNILEEKLKYHFTNEEYLFHALTHSSYANEHHLKRERNNERLEFLGDAILEMVSSEFIYHTEKEMPEGEMTKLRARLVCESSLAQCARELTIGDFLLMGKGEDVTGGRKRDSIISDAFEAVIGAIFLDGGITNAKEFIFRTVLSDVGRRSLFCDSKTTLQEIIQRDHKGTLSYRLISETGPEHQKCFSVAAYLDEQMLAVGTGRTKKAAEQEAAASSIRQLKTNKVEEQENAHVSEKH